MEPLKIFLFVMVMLRGIHSKALSINENLPSLRLNSNLPRIRLNSLILNGPTNVTVVFGIQKSSYFIPIPESQEPVLGYKIQLFETEMKKVTKFVEKDGKTVPVEELVPVEEPNYDIPTPVAEQVLPPDVFRATFIVKLGVHYEIRGQSYNADAVGPQSNSISFRFQSDEERKAAEEEKKKEEEEKKAADGKTE